MYKSFDMIVLTRSSKYGDYCVAGIDMSSGRFIRLVSDNGKTHGALSYRDLIMDNGCNANPLDVVHITNAQYCPGGTQKENYRIDRNEQLQYIHTITTKELSHFYRTTSQSGIFNAFEPIIQPAQARKLDHSLELVCVNNLRVYTELRNGKNRTKADFVKDGRKLSRFSVTDPNYYGNDGAINTISKALIVCSIADDDWAMEHGYYVFISAIHPILQDLTKDRTAAIENTLRPVNAGKPWLPEDDEKLLAMYKSGMSVNSIAGQFGRTNRAIQARLAKHGIADNYIDVPEYYVGEIIE